MLDSDEYNNVAVHLKDGSTVQADKVVRLLGAEWSYGEIVEEKHEDRTIETEAVVFRNEHIIRIHSENVDCPDSESDWVGEEAYPHRIHYSGDGYTPSCDSFAADDLYARLRTARKTGDQPHAGGHVRHPGRAGRHQRRPGERH